MGTTTLPRDTCACAALAGDDTNATAPPPACRPPEDHDPCEDDDDRRLVPLLRRRLRLLDRDTLPRLPALRLRRRRGCLPRGDALGLRDGRADGRVTLMLRRRGRDARLIADAPSVREPGRDRLTGCRCCGRPRDVVDASSSSSVRSSWRVSSPSTEVGGSLGQLLMVSRRLREREFEVSSPSTGVGSESTSTCAACCFASRKLSDILVFQLWDFCFTSAIMRIALDGLL